MVAPPEALPESLVRARSGRRRLRWLVVGFDVLAAGAAAVLAIAVAPAWGLPASVALAAAWPLAVGVAGGYTGLAQNPYQVRPRALLTAGALVATAAWVTAALASSVAEGETPQSLAAAALLLAGTACVASMTLRSLVPVIAPQRPRPTILVGEAAQVRALLREADRPARRRAFDPVAVCLADPDAEDLGPSDEPWPVTVRHCPEEQLLDLVRSHGAAAVVVTPGPLIDHAELRRWGTWLQDEDVDLLVSSGLRDVTSRRLELTTVGGARLLQVRPAPLSGPMHFLKLHADRALAALILLLVGPALALLALLVRLDSPGRALYRQTRIGRHGRPFTVYKLRTMFVDADRIVEELADANDSDPAGVLFKMKHDPRVTRVGSVLRTYSLDELPQLINVVRGEMSLVGPRPALPSEVQAYSPDLRRRLAVKPGLTGLWQVSGRSDLSWEDTVRLDLQYVDNWSWSLDLAIAVRTVGAVLGHKGAY
jgi:exopolysaccharide biosynthesis polyprenyl glycosylphosphotransferase